MERNVFNNPWSTFYFIGNKDIRFHRKETHLKPFSESLVRTPLKSQLSSSQIIDGKDRCYHVITRQGELNVAKPVVKVYETGPDPNTQQYNDQKFGR